MKIKPLKIAIYILIAIALIILAVCFYRWVNYMPSFSGWGDNPPYKTAKEYFGIKKYVTYESDEFKDNEEVQNLDIFLMDILNSAFENDGVLPERLDGIVSQEIYKQLDIGTSYGQNLLKEGKAYEVCEIEIPIIILYKDKAMADFRFYYSLVNKETNKSMSSHGNRMTPDANKIYLEEKDGNWYIIDYFAFP